jgi:hypothetical protein
LSPGNSTEDAADLGGGVDRIGLSATTFLLLGIWLGPDRACFLIAVAAILTVWFWACRRWPLVAVFTLGFFRGLLGR